VKTWTITSLILALMALTIIAMLAVHPITDWWWYQAMGVPNVFTRLLSTQLTLSAVAGLAFIGVLLLNVWIAKKSRPLAGVWIGNNLFEIPGLRPGFLEKVTERTAIIGTLFVALIIALEASSHTQQSLLYWHAMPFNKVDPVFGRDLSFYVFRLPFIEYVLGWVLVLLMFSLLFSGAVHVSYRAIQIAPNRIHFAPGARIHLGILSALLLLAYAWHCDLECYRLLNHDGPLLHGATYADLHATLPVLKALMVLSILAAVCVLINGFLRGERLAIIAFSVVVAVNLLGENLYPAALQHFVVAPNEIAKESEYLTRNIEATRYAFNLDHIQYKEFAVRNDLSAADVRANRDTVENIRLWDRSQLLDSYRQLQEIRSYYGFFDADNDRYTLDGRLTQVSLAAREMAYEKADSHANWINEHLTYTHGFGVCAGPVAQVAREGDPRFLIKDIPPQVQDHGPGIDQPRIYFGEHPSEYVFVDTKAKEFDYPNVQDVYARYEGKGGVTVGSTLAKIAFSLRFGEPKIALSSDIDANSRVLYYRSVVERASRITPWVTYDDDPYMAISNGRLYWILDGYTTSDNLPYARRFAYADTSINYMRNAVKTVIDAYDGTVNAYVADPDDPLIRSYQEIFPGVYQPLSAMPADLQKHVRYPENLFYLQALVLNLYHVEDPQVFYNKEDVWRIPEFDEDNEHRVMRPYYTVLKFPDGNSEEFILMLPFTPASRDNMIAWMAARCDTPNYGQLLVYKFPKQTNTYGPSQIYNRINSNPEISKVVSLWNQQGSKVRWGPLLVIPIKESLIYVRPLFLQATASNKTMPQLKQVVVAYGENIEMRPTLEEALAAVFNGTQGEIGTPGTTEPGTTPPGTPSPDTHETPGTPDWPTLVHQAQQHMDAAEKAQREGRWADYGAELDKLKAVLRQMDAQAAGHK
jgi:uncharacterized membrane protein (UPF0182 family)